jgi:ATP synthase F1 epsilon subunit
MSEKLLDIEIVSPQQQIFKGKAQSVNVPGALSPFQILFNHAPIFSTTDIGIVKIVSSNNEQLFFAVNSGFVEVANNNVSIVVEQACSPDEIVEKDVLDLVAKYEKEIDALDIHEQINKDTILNKIQYEKTKLKLLSHKK